MMMKTVTLIYGDGIGKEVIAAAKAVVEATGADIAWEIQDRKLRSCKDAEAVI